MKTKSKLFWLTAEERSTLARHNIAKLKRQVPTKVWKAAFKEVL